MIAVEDLKWAGELHAYEGGDRSRVPFDQRTHLQLCPPLCRPCHLHIVNKGETASMNLYCHHVASPICVRLVPRAVCSNAPIENETSPTPSLLLRGHINVVDDEGNLTSATFTVNV